MTRAALSGLAYVFRNLPIQSGLTKLSFNPIVDFLVGNNSAVVTARLRDGHTIDVTLDDYHGRILYLFGTNDPKVEKTANSLLRPGDVFLDIGANYSSIGLSASRVVGAGGEVHLFEPQKKLADRVEQSIALGGHQNVSLHRIGLLDRNDTLVLRSPSYHSGLATFVQSDSRAPFELEEVCEVRNISEYVGPLVANRTFGVKLDVEGAEPALMPWLLAQRNLSFLIFEAASNQAGLYELVRAAGLTLYGLKRNLLRLRAERVDNFEEMRKFHDLIALAIHNGPKLAHPKDLASRCI